MTSRNRPAAEDLTARARIRDAALEQFAEYGFDRATIRGIAQAAAVSPGLVRHHFGSKNGLREACDAYALQVLHGYVDEVMTDVMAKGEPGAPEAFVKTWAPLNQFRWYIARAMIDGSEGAARIFDEMVAMTERTLRQADTLRPDPPADDLRARSALMVAMALGVPAFRAHIARNIGVDIVTQEGDRRVTLALLDIQSHPTITPEAARGLRQVLDKQGT
jgi:TetR/AcrR family transcriptional regulator, regulator of cefoperazone and chloramphenicol sensitivity